MANWYAVHTKPRQEFIAEENLRRQAYETYLPLIKEAKRYKGKWQHIIEPLFPRYLFISLKLGIDNIQAIHSTRGVSTLVRFGIEPTPIPNSFVEALKKTGDRNSGIHVPQRPLLNEGDLVTIVDGPLSGLKGIFQTMQGEERVILLLDILGKHNTVTLKRDLIWCA